MTKQYCDICGVEITTAANLIQLGHHRMDVCERCLQSACIHFSVLQNQYRNIRKETAHE